MQEQLPRDAAVERTGMYSQRVPNVYVRQVTHTLIILKRRQPLVDIPVNINQPHFVVAG